MLEETLIPEPHLEARGQVGVANRVRAARPAANRAAGEIERNRLSHERVPPEGLIILRDGDVGEPEVLLSPLSHVWTPRVADRSILAGGRSDAISTICSWRSPLFSLPIRR